MRLLQEDGVPLSRLDESLPRYRITPDIRLPFAGDVRELLAVVARGLAAYPTSRLDGVRVAFPDCWGLVRSSITEPLVTLRCEGKTAARLACVTGLVLDALPGDLAAAARSAVPAV